MLLVHHLGSGAGPLWPESITSRSFIHAQRVSSSLRGNRLRSEGFFFFFGHFLRGGSLLHRLKQGGGGESPEPLHLCTNVCMSVIWGMPLDVMIAPAEDCFWPDLQETNMRLKIRVRRMKEGRELRGVYPHARMIRACFCVKKCMIPSLCGKC